MKKTDVLFSSRKFRTVVFACGAAFLAIAAVFLFLFFREGGFGILFAKAKDFKVVMSADEYVFDKIGEKFVLSASLDPDDGVELTFSSSNEDIVNVTADGTVTSLKGGVAAVKASCEIKG